LLTHSLRIKPTGKRIKRTRSFNNKSNRMAKDKEEKEKDVRPKTARKSESKTKKDKSPSKKTKSKELEDVDGRQSTKRRSRVGFGADNSPSKKTGEAQADLNDGRISDSSSNVEVVTSDGSSGDEAELLVDADVIIKEPKKDKRRLSLRLGDWKKISKKEPAVEELSSPHVARTASVQTDAAGSAASLSASATAGDSSGAEQNEDETSDSTAKSPGANRLRNTDSSLTLSKKVGATTSLLSDPSVTLTFQCAGIEGADNIHGEAAQGFVRPQAQGQAGG
jgi:hypothetical protein